MIDDDKNETITSLLHTIALIREAAGVGEKPMLSELPDVIRKLRKERDEARRELCAARRELCRSEAIIRLQRHHVHRDSEDVVGLAKEIAVERGWDCFNTPEHKLVKTLNGVITNKGKATPPEYLQDLG